MIKKYIAIEHKNSRYWKGVPYISKKEFKKNKNNLIIGKTKLKKYKSSSENKELDLLLFNNKEFEIKERLFGFKKGYVFVGDDKYIALKRRIPFLFLLLLLLIVFIMFRFLIPCNNQEDKPIVVPVQKEVITPEDNEDKETIKEEINIEKPNKVKPSSKQELSKEYKITFDGNGGYGSMESILCKLDNICILNKNKYTKEGYSFEGWSTKKNGVTEFQDKAELKNLSSKNGDNITLYAVWEIKSYQITFLDYDKSIIQQDKLEYNSKIILPENPTRKGYTFKNWDKELSIVKENLTINALYDIDSYDISYKLNGGTLDEAPTNYNIESEDIIIPSPKKVGYSFIGWTTPDNKEPIIDYKISTGSVDNIELEANYDANIYNLIFNSKDNNDSLIKRKIKFDSEYGILPEVEKDGYTFNGWKNSNGDFVSSDTLYNVPEDTNLYAEWNLITYDIKYNLNGGTLDEAPTNYNVTSKLNKNQFTKEGYTFIGWSTSIDGDVMFNDESEISNLSSKDKDVITLYAKWEIIKLNVKYYDLFGALLKSETVEYGNKSVAPEDMFIDGYTFEGWNPSLGVIREDTIYKAQYTINEYTIKYNFNTGSNDDAQEIKYNVESDTITLPTPTRTGYTFLGWTGSNGLKPQLEVIIHKGSIDDKTYKANWVSNSYKVSLNANGGVVNEDYIMISYNSLYGTIPTPTRVGYTFEGWYYNDTLITEDSIQDKEFDHELVANWKTIQYDITYNLAGGTASPLQTSYNIESDSFVLPIPTRTGYTFTGWTGTDLSSLSKNVTINKGTIGNRSYTANWTINYYTVNYYVNGSLWATRSVAYNTALENLDAQSALDIYHKFNYWEGWIDKMPTNTVNLYANITESYCMLMTGHGPYKNAEGLLNVFKSAGWTGKIEEAPSAPGFYWVVTDYPLTRAQADIQRDYIANHTNYTNYNYPYLYWVAVSCTNGIGDTWTRSVGTKQFTSQYQ